MPDDASLVITASTRKYLSRRTALEALLAAVVAGAMSLIVFGPILKWIAVGWSGGDMLSTYVNAEVWRGFAYGETTQFGFPLGMNLNYFPNIDITENLFAQLVTNVTGKPFVGINLLIMLTFPLVAALTYLVIRMTGLQGPLAIALAVAYALIPFHWGRALGHTYLSTLYSLVIGLAIVLLVGSGTFQDLLARTKGNTKRRAFLIIVVAVMCVVTAWTGLYYAAFTLLLGAAALLWRWAHGARWRNLLWDAIPFAAVGVLSIIGFLPGLMAVKGDPPLASLGDRVPYESVQFAGNLAMAVLPLPQSSLPGMEKYNAKIVEAIGVAPWGESTAIANHGTWITSAALLVMLLGLAWRTRQRARGIQVREGKITLTFITYLTIAALLFFIPWGLNYLFAGTVTPQVRGWNRLVPMLLLLFILGAAVVLARTKVATKWLVATPIALMVLGLVAIDSAYPFQGAYAESVKAGAKLSKAATEYGRATNTAIPENCGVLQLPYMAYPEFGKIGDINDYDHFWTSLLNPGKSWSYGAVKNTDASVWASQLAAVPSEDELAILRAEGFCAIHLDLRGTISEKRPELVNAFESRLGAPVASALGGRWLLFQLGNEPIASSENAKRFMKQAFIEVDPASVSPQMTTGLQNYWLTLAPEATMTLKPTDASAPVTGLRGSVQGTSCGPRPVTITIGEGASAVSTTVVAKPEENTPFSVALPNPASTEIPVTIYAPGDPCQVGSYSAFTRISDLAPYGN